jgi:hypothetical protein
MSKILTRDDILTAGQPATETVEVPEWGGAVIVRELTVAEVFSIGPSGLQAMTAEVVARLLAAALVDAEGNRLFTPEQASEIAGMKMGPVMRLLPVITRLSGLDTEGHAVLSKNSETGPTEEPATPSHQTLG